MERRVIGVLCAEAGERPVLKSMQIPQIMASEKATTLMQPAARGMWAAVGVMAKNTADAAIGGGITPPIV